MKSKDYFKAEWKLCLHQRAANYTSKTKTMGCTTTQRVESRYRALKRKMISPLHLCVAFDKVHEYLKDFQRNYDKQKLQDETISDKVISEDDNLSHPRGKIGHLALYKLREELYREPPVNLKHYFECNCKNIVIYGLLYYNQLDALGNKSIQYPTYLVGSG